MIYIFPISKFDIAADQEPYTDEKGKELQPIIIGEERKQGENPVPIVEYMYTDVISAALEGTIKMAPFGGLIPPILFYDNNGIVPHNDSLALFMEEIKQTLSFVPYTIKIDSMKELAGIYLDKSPGKIMTIRKDTITNKLIGLVSAKASTKFNNFLIIEMLKEEMRDSDPPSPLGDSLGNLSKKDLIALFGDCKEYKETGKTRNPQLESLISAHGEDAAIHAITWEFTNRCFNQERTEN